MASSQEAGQLEDSKLPTTDMHFPHSSSPSSMPSRPVPSGPVPSATPSPNTVSSLHALLLLADSALPLSAFAFSSGLESYLAHHPQRDHHSGLPASSAPRVSLAPSSSSFAAHSSLQTSHSSNLSLFLPFLEQSITSVTRTGLPFVLAAYDAPTQLPYWDDTCDASTLCNVARRQSVEQGRALTAVWLRGLHGLDAVSANSTDTGGSGDSNDDIGTGAAQLSEPRTALLAFDRRLKRPRRHPRGGTSGYNVRVSTANADDADDGNEDELDAHGHLAPLFGTVARAAGLGRHEAAYVFLLNHAKSVISAAVRAGVCGPFKQQELLAGSDLRSLLERSVHNGERVFAEQGVGGAGQTIPMLDIWQGRHELLYSRVFNS